MVLNAHIACAKNWSEEQEKAVGAEVAAEIEKQYKLWDNEDGRKLIEDILGELVPHTDRPALEYTVKMLDSDEVNACSIPGGFIYVHRGLVEDAQSVDELAAILAHEIAHNCTYDAMDQARRSKKLFIGGITAALVAIFLGASNEQIAGVLTAGSYVQQGVLSRYSIEIEQRADLNAVRYLTAAKYDPVGLLTFMERLGAKAYKKPQIDYGIYQSHPITSQRCAYLVEAIYEAGLTVNRRAVTKWDPPTYVSIGPDGAEYPPEPPKDEAEAAQTDAKTETDTKPEEDTTQQTQPDTTDAQTDTNTETDADTKTETDTKPEEDAAQQTQPDAADTEAKPAKPPIDRKTAPAKISLWGEDIVTIGSPGTYDGIDKRAEAICKILTETIAAGLERYEIRATQDSEKTTVVLRGKTMLEVFPEDIPSEKLTAEQVAQGVVKALARALHREELSRRF